MAAAIFSLNQERQSRLAQLIEHLLQSGWTQTTLAQSIGVDFSTVYRWMKGKTIPEFDSKNFRQLAKLSGGNPRKLQLYLDGEILLSDYLKGSQAKPKMEMKEHDKMNAEEIKKEVLAKICLLDPPDIAEIISRTAMFLAQHS